MSPRIWPACVALVLYALMPQTSSSAQTFYRCLGAQGVPEFSAQPCDAGRPPAPRASVAPPASPHEKPDSPACRQARQALAAAAGVFPASPDLHARRAAVHAACRLDVPEVTIINRPAAP